MHCNLQTEKSCVYWIKSFGRGHGRSGAMRHPRVMGKLEMEPLLTKLAIEGRVSTSTHRQALSALLYPYKKVVGLVLPLPENRRVLKRFFDVNDPEHMQVHSLLRF